ncbi:MAG: sensor histidine kinase, partial [Roseiflexaceae bacterium]
SAEELIGRALGCDTPIPAIIITEGPSNCFDQLGPKQFGYSQIATSEAETGDILFFSLPLSSTGPLDRVPFSAPLALDSSAPPSLSLAQVQKSETMMLAIGAGQQGGPALPAITIRRTQGRTADPIQAGFIGTVNRSLLLAAGAAGLAALLLTTVLSRRILGPVEALTAAARRMEKGDLTQHVAVRSKDEIGELARAFNAMVGGLARIEQLRRHMVTDVAHELRTPLTNIRGYLEALRDGVAEPSPELIGSLHEEALLLNRLVDDLQDLALAEAGQLRLARHPTSLGMIVDRAVGALRPALDEKGLAIDVQMPVGLPCVDADPERIGQVLRNLLNNAITHTPPSGCIGVEAEYIADCRLQIADYSAGQSTIYNLQSAILVRVRDTGAGIPPEQLTQIFERFYRADPSRARATGGAGLGLTVVKQLVEAHGGQVWASSAPGQGATFTFTLPVAG